MHPKVSKKPLLRLLFGYGNVQNFLHAKSWRLRVHFVEGVWAHKMSQRDALLRVGGNLYIYMRSIIFRY